MIARENAFSANACFFGTVIFNLNEEGDVVGLKVTNGRVRNLEFVKLDQ